MKPELGDQGIEEIHNDFMNVMALTMDMELNGDLKGLDRKYGFILMVFEFGDEHKGRCNYISNARRQDVVQLLEDQLKKFKEDKR